MVINELEKHLSDVGYVTEHITASNGQVYLVIRNVQIAAGKLAGKTCDVAVLRSTGNPWIPQAAVQVRPHLVPMGHLATRASPLGPEWQYWSRRFDRVPTPRGFLAHILTVLGEV